MDGESGRPIADDAVAWLRQLATTSPHLDEVRDLVQLFIDDGRVRVTSLRSAAGAADFDLVRTLAHNLRGSSATFGANEVAAICRRIQDLAEQGDRDGVRATISALDAAMSAAAAALEAEFFPTGGGVSPPTDG